MNFDSLRTPAGGYLAGVFDLQGNCVFNVNKKYAVNAKLRISSKNQSVLNLFESMLGGKVVQGRWDIYGTNAEQAAHALLDTGLLLVSGKYVSTWLAARQETRGLQGGAAHVIRTEWANRVAAARPTTRRTGGKRGAR